MVIWSKLDVEVICCMMNHAKTQRPKTATVVYFAQESADVAGLGGNSSFLLHVVSVA